MAPQPKKKLSKIRRGQRQATLGVKVRSFVRCPECGEPKLAHTVCKNCGKYNKTVVIKTKVEPKVTRVQK